MGHHRRKTNTYHTSSSSSFSPSPFFLLPPLSVSPQFCSLVTAGEAFFTSPPSLTNHLIIGQFYPAFLLFPFFSFFRSICFVSFFCNSSSPVSASLPFADRACFHPFEGVSFCLGFGLLSSVGQRINFFEYTIYDDDFLSPPHPHS